MVLTSKTPYTDGPDFEMFSVFALNPFDTYFGYRMSTVIMYHATFHVVTTVMKYLYNKIPQQKTKILLRNSLSCVLCLRSKWSLCPYPALDPSFEVSHTRRIFQKSGRLLMLIVIEMSYHAVTPP